MKNNTYSPNPVDTSDVELSQELLTLAEQLAQNVHEVWSQTRIAQGWTWGPERNDALKQHPCLVPYDQLSEEEKVFDRNTSQETLRLITKLGYKIVEP